MKIEEILNSRKKSIILPQDTHGLRDHCMEYDFHHIKDFPKVMGQYFLYEITRDRSHSPRMEEIEYPKLGVFINMLPCDQTIELEWVNYRRTWEYSIKHDYDITGKDGSIKTYSNYVGEIPTEINRLILWSDSMLIYGVWDSKPNWYQLRQAYEKTWWFFRDKDEKRDIQLNRILK